MRSYFWRRYVVVILASLVIGVVTGVKSASLVIGILDYILSSLAFTLVLIIYMMSNRSNHWYD
jgi:hypothetical protein